MSIRLIIMGPQGSGKGTQAARLAERFGIPTISTGDLFRAHISQATELGVLVQTYTARGDLVPDEVTNAMVRERLDQPDVTGGFILDGYPRNAAQVVELDQMLDRDGLAVDGALELVVDREALLARIARRAELEGREDDTPEAIARRLDIYAEQTAPLAHAYADRGLLVKVDGEGAVEEITERLVAAVQGLTR